MRINKVIGLIFILMFCISCDSEDANDCFQKSGSTTTTEVNLPSFSKIRVNKGISLVIKEGPIQQVLLETGENLWNDIAMNVVDGRLTITNHNNCNWIRSYNTTKVYATVPNLVELICSTQYQISSDGVLNFDTLKIFSDNFQDPSVLALGEVFLEVNSQNIEVLGNGKTCFTLRGNLDYLNIYIADNHGYFNGRNLKCNKTRIYHRGTNTITVHPVLELFAELRSTGNVIAINKPPTVQIKEFYTGRVIFE